MRWNMEFPLLFYLNLANMMELGPQLSENIVLNID